MSGRRTSISVETVVWDGLEDISNREELTLAELLTLIDQRRLGSSLASAVRVFVLFYFRSVADIAQPLIRAAHPPVMAQDDDGTRHRLTPPNTLPGLLDKVLDQFSQTRAELSARNRADQDEE